MSNPFVLGLSVALSLPCGVWAADLQLPGNATLEFQVAEAQDRNGFAIGPWDGGQMPVEEVSGPLTRQAWHIAASGLTTEQLIGPLRAQLTEAGYDILFECDTQACGGFDFRFALTVLPPPHMHVNLGDYRYLSARHADGAYASVLASRTELSGFVQITTVGQGESALSGGASSGETLRAIAPPLASGSVGEQLETNGFAVLADLSFERGSSQLTDQPFASLADLADYLANNPNRRVYLVGHTDSEGSLDGNIALSRRRAASVLERLVSAFGTDRRQMAAQGMGFLSPVATNLTEEGREANRRVEVILVSIE